MTQGNLSSNEDRSRPRFEAPPVTGPNGSGKPGSGGQPAIKPATAQPPAMPNPVRPSDWPAPDQEAALPFQAPDPVYPVPPPSNSYDWAKAASAPASKPKSGNLYRYETYNATPATPPPPLDPQADAYRQASRRVRARLDFQKHLWSYLLVNGFLWIIYFMTVNPTHQTFWPIWSTVFWGIGLLAQWWHLSGREDDRRRRMVEEEMRWRNRF